MLPPCGCLYGIERALTFSRFSLTDDLAFQLLLSYPRGGDRIALRAGSARECHFWMADIDIACQSYKDAQRKAAARALDRRDLDNPPYP